MRAFGERQPWPGTVEERPTRGVENPRGRGRTQRAPRPGMRLALALALALGLLAPRAGDTAADEDGRSELERPQRAIDLPAIDLPADDPSPGVPADDASLSEFQDWLDREGLADTFEELRALLAAHDVAEVVEPWTLLRQGTDWRAVRLAAFAFPPRETWENVIPTLRVLRDEIIPRVGRVRIVSGYRSPTYNEQAGGAPSSAHLTFRALDVVPLQRRPREELHGLLEGYWESGDARLREVGIGFYRSPTGRFHVDAGRRHRRW